MVDAAWSAGRLKAEGVVEESSGVEEEVFWGSLLLEEFKNLPLNGFENREEGLTGRKNQVNITVMSVVVFL